MFSAAQLRLIARDHRKRAIEAASAAAQAMHLAMAAEFDRDAELAGRDERRWAFRTRSDVAVAHAVRNLAA